jgi:hypothetical protein
MMEKSPRVRDENYLDYIRSLRCCICGDDTSVEAAHLRVGSVNDGKQPAGMAQKSSDRWALPLCGRHHREQHATGNEMEFWLSYAIDPFALAMHYRARPR